MAEVQVGALTNPFSPFKPHLSNIPSFFYGNLPSKFQSFIVPIGSCFGIWKMEYFNILTVEQTFHFEDIYIAKAILFMYLFVYGAGMTRNNLFSRQNDGCPKD